jgi:UDP-2,3-diacylglucosamine pyrophosphatase LpxH
MPTAKRHVEVVVISDIHLGTYGASAKELNAYLNSIDPDKIIINGDWIDIWYFDMNYWPTEHAENIFIILDFIKQGKPVYYVTGNHDDDIRKFTGTKLKSFQVVDELDLLLDGKKHWVLHGDKYDQSVGGKAKWLAKLGGKAYDYSVRMNRKLNNQLVKMGKERILISKMIKDSVKKAVKSGVSDFEQITCEEGIKRGYDFVICGHIHKPQKRVVTTKNGSVTYLNSGDWVENCTSLEYNEGEWSIFSYYKD